MLFFNGIVIILDSTLPFKPTKEIVLQVYKRAEKIHTDISGATNQLDLFYIFIPQASNTKYFQIFHTVLAHIYRSRPLTFLIDVAVLPYKNANDVISLYSDIQSAAVTPFFNCPAKLAQFWTFSIHRLNFSKDLNDFVDTSAAPQLNELSPSPSPSTDEEASSCLLHRRNHLETDHLVSAALEDADVSALEDTLAANTSARTFAVGGSFDGLHYGHVLLLHHCVSLLQGTTSQVSSLLAVGVSCDDHLMKKPENDFVLTFETRRDLAAQALTFLLFLNGLKLTYYVSSKCADINAIKAEYGREGLRRYCRPESCKASLARSGTADQVAQQRSTREDAACGEQEVDGERARVSEPHVESAAGESDLCQKTLLEIISKYDADTYWFEDIASGQRTIVCITELDTGCIGVAGDIDGLQVLLATKEVARGAALVNVKRRELGLKDLKLEFAPIVPTLSYTSGWTEVAMSRIEGKLSSRESRKLMAEVWKDTSYSKSRKLFGWILRSLGLTKTEERNLLRFLIMPRLARGSLQKDNEIVMDEYTDSPCQRREAMYILGRHFLNLDISKAEILIKCCIGKAAKNEEYFSAK